MSDSQTPLPSNDNRAHPKFYWFYVLAIVATLATTVFQPGLVRINTASALAPGSISFTLVTGPSLVSDSNKCPAAGPTASYVGFKVTNTTGSTLPNLSATLSGFTTGFALAGGQAGTLYIGTLAAGASTTVFYYVSYPCALNTGSPTDNLTLTVSDGTAQTNAFTQTFTTVQTISANAGGQISSTVLGIGAVVGQVITYDVGYTFGNISSSDHFLLQPAGLPSFNAGCFQLVSTNIITSGINAIPTGSVNQLYFTSTTNQSGSGNTVTAEYGFKVLCTGVTTTATPFASQLSGTQDKYTGNFNGAGTTITVPPAVNDFTIGKSVTPNKLATGGTVTYTVTITNSFSQPTFIDTITDTLPAGVTYNGLTTSSDVTAANSSSLPATGSTGNLVFNGTPGSSYSVPANGFINLIFTATVINTPGTYTNTATASTGSTNIGSATANVVVGSADLSLVKTVSNSFIEINQNVTYTLTLKNLGTSTATNVAVTDQLPVGVSYSSSTPSQGTYSSITGIWTVGTLVNNATATLSLSGVVTTATTVVTNTTLITAADQFDPNISNNQSSAVFTATYANGISKFMASPNQINFTSDKQNQQVIQLSSTMPNPVDWTASVIYDTGAKGWVELGAFSGKAFPGTNSQVKINTNPAKLKPGNYNATVYFVANNDTNTQVAVKVNMVIVSPYTYYIPYLANGENGFSSNVLIHNIGSSTANIQTQYFDQNGNILNVQANACNDVATDAQCSPINPFTNSISGAGVLTSNQPLSIVVTEQTPFGGSAYTVGTGASASLVAPLAINNAGGFSTQLNIFNAGASPSQVTISFYDQSGAQISAATKVTTIAAHSNQGFDQTATGSNLPAGFYGWAKIEGAAGASLVAQVLEQNSSAHFVALANAPGVNSSHKLYAPAIYKGAFGGFVTGANLVNPNDSPVQVTVTYYRQDGTAFAAAPFTLAGHALQPVYQGANGGNGLPDGGLADGFTGAAVVESTGTNNLIMAVNESGGQTAQGTAQSGTYIAATSGSNKLGLPVVANNNNGYTSGVSILNTSDQIVNGYLQYYNSDGTTAGASQLFVIQPHASYLAYQGASNLPNGFIGQASIVQTNGTSNSLLATTNVQSSNLFYSYTEQVQ